MASVEGIRVLLTGASSGIGEQAARILAARGAQLALVARREQRLRQLSDELKASGHTEPAVIPADLGQPGAAAEVAARASEALGEIDVLVNNAGASIHGLTWVGGDRPEARAVFETNLWSPLALVAAVAPAMVERGKGTIVNTGSMVQVSPFPHVGHYSASRAALASVTETMRLELGPRGIRVVEVAFGPVDTAASTENRLLSGGEQWLEGRPGIGKLESAAETLVKAIEGPAEGFVVYPRVLGWVRAFPALGRRYARQAAKRADLTDTTLRTGGSAGDKDIQEARHAWERTNAS
jgi:short-subunit dehydrogenase